MKDCSGDYDSTIQLYLDGEMSGADLEVFEAHLKDCGACLTQLEALEGLSRLLHRSRPLYSAPDALRDRILRITEPSPSSASYPPPRLQMRILKLLARPLQSAGSGVPRWPVLVAAILLVSALLPLPGILRQPTAHRYLEPAVPPPPTPLNAIFPLTIKSQSPT